MIKLSFRGDGFGKMKRQIDLAKKGDAFDAVRKAIAAEAITQVGLGFRSESDPYGVSWQPLKYRKGRILSKTGRMRRSFTVHPVSGGFRLGSSAQYTLFHQFGTGGRKKTSTRFQPVNASGRFVTKSSRKRKPMKGLTGGSVGIRALTHKQGSGALPARPMVPIKEHGLGRWSIAFKKAAARAVRKLMKG